MNFKSARAATPIKWKGRSIPEAAGQTDAPLFTAQFRRLRSTTFRRLPAESVLRTGPAVPAVSSSRSRPESSPTAAARTPATRSEFPRRRRSVARASGAAALQLPPTFKKMRAAAFLGCYRRARGVGVSPSVLVRRRGLSGARARARASPTTFGSSRRSHRRLGLLAAPT